MSENFNFELKRQGDIAIFKLDERRFDAQIAGLVKGELTILLHTEEVSKLIFDLSKSSLLSIFFAKGFAAYFPIVNPIIDPKVSPIHITGMDR